MGEYEDGVGGRWQDPNYMKFYNGGQVPFPYLSDGMWFLTQFKRWGLLKDDPDYPGIARQINQLALYKQAAAQVNVAVPAEEMRRSTLMDGKVWNGEAPEKYAASFKIKT